MLACCWQPPACLCAAHSHRPALDCRCACVQAAAASYGFVWNVPQWTVPASMGLFVPAQVPLQYAGQLQPQQGVHSQAPPQVGLTAGPVDRCLASFSAAEMHVSLVCVHADQRPGLAMQLQHPATGCAVSQRVVAEQTARPAATQPVLCAAPQGWYSRCKA